MLMLHKGRWLANERDVIEAVKDYDYELGECVAGVIGDYNYMQQDIEDLMKENEDLEREKKEALEDKDEEINELKDKIEELEEKTALLQNIINKRDKEIEQKWLDLMDLVTYEDSDMKLRFENPLYLFDASFEAGTDVEDVWKWFDEHHSKGVGWLSENIK